MFATGAFIEVAKPRYTCDLLQRSLATLLRDATSDNSSEVALRMRWLGVSKDEVEPSTLRKDFSIRKHDEKIAMLMRISLHLGRIVLQELFARRRQKRLLELMGKLEWDNSFDYKAERIRD